MLPPRDGMVVHHTFSLLSFDTHPLIDRQARSRRTGLTATSKIRRPEESKEEAKDLVGNAR